MNCKTCGSSNTFNRQNIVLCLNCGTTWAREKIGPSVVDLQLQIKALQAQLINAIVLTDHYRSALVEIAEHATRNGNQPDMMSYFTLKTIAKTAIEGVNKHEDRG